MTERQPPPPAEYFFERYPWNHRWILFGFALGISGFDLLATRIILFPALLLIPVVLLAWNCGLRTALTLGSILCVVRVCVQYAWGIPYSLEVAILNGFTRIGLLLLIAFLFGKLAEQTRALRARVRTLEGILPTCAFCKDIRDETGNWHQIEAYVASRTQASFSHGVCPTCAAEHYGEILSQAAKSAAESGAREAALSAGKGSAA